jgi:hypothetical protein
MWEDNITMDIMEIGWEDMDWIHLAQGRDSCRDLVKTVNGCSDFMKAGEFLDSLSYF